MARAPRLSATVCVPSRASSAFETALIAIGIVWTSRSPVFAAVTIVSSAIATCRVKDTVTRSPAGTCTSRRAARSRSVPRRFRSRLSGRSGNAKSPAAPVSAGGRRAPDRHADAWQRRHRSGRKIEPDTAPGGLRGCGRGQRDSSTRIAAEQQISCVRMRRCISFTSLSLHVPYSRRQRPMARAPRWRACWPALARRRAKPSRRSDRCWCCNRSTAAT